MNQRAPLRAASTNEPFCKEDQGSFHTMKAASLLLAHLASPAAAARCLCRVPHPSWPMQDAQHAWWLHQEEHAGRDAKDLTLSSSQPSPLPSLHRFGLYLKVLLTSPSPSPRFPFISHPSFHLLSPNSSEDVLLYVSCKIYTK